MDPMEAIKATFFQECEELLADLEAGLLALSNGEGDGETINAVFRAVHSVKGGAGAFGLEDLVKFAHVFETLLDELRAERIACGEAVIHTLLRASDVLADHVQAAKGVAPRVDDARSAGLVAELETWIHGEAAPVPVAAEPEPIADEFGFTPIAFDFGAPAEEVVAADGWRVTFRPHGRMYANANEAGLLLRELARLGPTTVSLDEAGVPALADLAPEEGCIAWTVRLDGGVSEDAIRDVFDFVDGDCDVEIAREASEAPAADDTTLPPPADLDIAALLAAATAAVDATPAPESAPVSPSPEPAAEVAAAAPFPSVPAAAPAAAAPAAAPAAVAGAAPQATIRVDLERVDRLINVVGELVIQQAMLSQRVTESGLARSSGIAVGLEDLELLTREIQDSVMAIRAQPVKSVFQRMPRLVREVADMTGKRVRLVTEGENTEVDKTVIERLSDPITHMLRNAIDHGLESPEERIAAGKPAEGVVRLAALHRSGRIVIEVGDDGKGINRERVRQIAVNKGLIESDAVLSDDEVDNLIFLPGFSTAEVISNVSGRGVGMDVVKRSIQALGGRISIVSRPGHGSTFTMSLPLTLAVLDGMVVGAAGQTLVAPLSSIVESLTPRAQDVHY
ncbi:MAG TPA: chemotaxis protein CheA, partial [Caulobacteraceae bacterium]|nr:chemotaxis protein CheA [Caulobacteraceae bacterium]